MELSKIANNVGQWLLDAIYHNEGSVDEIYEMVVTVYNEEEDETKKEKLKDSLKTTCKRLTVEDTMEEVNEALAVLLERLEREHMSELDKEIMEAEEIYANCIASYNECYEMLATEEGETYKKILKSWSEVLGEVSNKLLELHSKK